MLLYCSLALAFEFFSFVVSWQEIPSSPRSADAFDCLGLPPGATKRSPDGCSLCWIYNKWKGQCCKLWFTYFQYWDWSGLAERPVILNARVCLSFSHQTLQLEDPLDHMCIGWCKDPRSYLDIFNKFLMAPAVSVYMPALSTWLLIQVLDFNKARCCLPWACKHLITVQE